MKKQEINENMRLLQCQMALRLICNLLVVMGVLVKQPAVGKLAAYNTSWKGNRKF